jgi:osmoprotectant transport system substrate-binding protein
MKPNRSQGGVLLLGLILVLGACTDAPAPPADREAGAIDVATFDFPESMLLGEIYAQALEAAGFAVERHIGFGSRELVMPAMAQHSVDFVPEYVGTALQFVSLGAQAPSADESATRRTLKPYLADQGMTLLASARGQNQNGFVVTDDLAEGLDLGSISDLRQVDQGLSFGGPPECPERAFCLGGLETVYGLDFGDFLATDSGGPITRSALLAGEVDVALLFTTDPAIERYDLVLLEDDRQLQPAENVTPVVQTELIEQHGRELTSTVNNVTAHLSTAELRRLNGLVNDDASNLHEIASQWLAQIAED